MKVFVDATGITAKPTGLAKYSLKLLSALVDLTSYQYVILCSSDLPYNHDLFGLADDRICFIKRNISPIGPFRDLAYVFLKAEIEKCDIYHCLSSYLPFFGVPVPSVVTIHDLKYVRYPNFLSNWLKALYLRRIIINTLYDASHIIAVSDSTRRDLVDLGADAKKTSVIHEASVIDPPIERSSEKDVFFSGRYFLFVGENRPHKNLDRLLKAFQLLVQDFPEESPHLVIAGNGTQALREKIVKFGLADKTIVLGAVSDEDLVRLYSGAFAFVFPSLYEGFGLPVLEAMSFGVPVVTSNITSTAEVAGNAAILVNPYSIEAIKRGMVELMIAPSRYVKLVIQGPERARLFSWEKTAQETINIYDQLA